ncbi:MAG: RagB/SusD family nutrient uptake outer membrane protein [Flavobacteriaceae bacterium]|nr:RagB/SusD family nutrient uptake outer membrane protein [Flavobacteriaceae bacterium]
MMNKYNKIIGLFLAVTVFSLVSCSEDYLEKEPSGGILTKKQLDEIAKTDPSITEGLVTGLYNYMTQPQVGGINGSNEDFGQKGNDIISDMLSCDMAYTDAYARYRWIVNLESMANYRSDFPHYMFWRYYYKIIYQANAVIGAYGGNDAVPSLEKGKWLLGQAKAMRAYAYLYLAMYYTTEYKPEEKVLVLYKEQANKAKPQVATKEVMDLVVKDLKDAISLLSTFNRGDKSKINKNVAKGLLAYAYGYMGQYDKVVTLSDEIINSGEFTLTPKTGLYSGMNTIANEPGWMWGVDIVADMKLNLTSFLGQMDYFTYSYARFGGYKKIDNLLYEKISPKDLRKKQFGIDLGPDNGGVVLLPVNKFYSFDKPGMKAGGVSVEEDYVYMRVAEFYLLKAEAQAKLGQDAEAKQTLKPFLNERYESPADYADILSKTGQELQDEIYLQTRIEFWGEGKSYFAMKRNKATVKRGENHSHLPNTEYKYDDPRLTLKVPQDEVENNPNIKQ